MELLDAAGMFDELMPMHVLVAEDGRILHAGPTLQKLRPDLKLRGQVFADVFEVLRPRTVAEGLPLHAVVGTKLSLRLRSCQEVALKGVVVATPSAKTIILNLTFGIGVVEAVGDFGLTSADFAASDLTIEMLYLVEAKSAAMEASRQLNKRLQGAMIAAQEKAYTDGLTGLKNRRAMDYVLEQTLATRQPFALMQLDLDFFKTVNDTLGHAAGDAVLREVALILTDETRDSDTVSRVGGDEFVLILSGFLSEAKLAEVSNRLIRRIEEPVMFQGEECRISASIGIANTAIYQNPPCAQKIMADADTALYASKRKGRAQFTIFDPKAQYEAETPAAAASVAR